MKKRICKLKRMMSALIIAALCVEMSGFVSYAAETDETEESAEVEVLEAQVTADVEWSSDISLQTMLLNCMIVVGRQSDGMHINITTDTLGKSSVIGVKDIEIWKKNSKGEWELVATSKGGENKDSYSCGVTLTYANAVVGATYKITCVHYGNVNGLEEYKNDSGDFIYNFPIGNSHWD